MTTIMSIQSHVAYGYVGNSAAVFPLQRLGVEVWPVLTVNFSNHTGYGAWRGPLIEAEQVSEVVQGIRDRGVLGRADALLSGFQGSADMGQVILSAAVALREENPGALYCCDPVMGDVDTGFYCLPGIPEFMRDEVVPRADVLTPNLFELEFLVGREVHTICDVMEAAQQLRRQGPKTVLVTSVRLPDGRDDAMRMIAVTEEGAWQVETPRIDGYFTGTGDFTSALFLAKILEGLPVGVALEQTASVVYSVLRATADLGRSELALVQAQDHVVAPGWSFRATKIG
ncbi:MAG: pyridoxal kinase PdxY [Luteococcus sp.]|uniref:pyridoxal kinase PdxY n=1 Tax=Luteococcus sp. TaxID=1969402 RepID=UPI0026473C33|nr:pyridoxal kinase PdxY [Luteococcus sp.]MDN5562910.1 pyridoxal kinase PdxY [Luteococcus sp.]